MTEALAAVVRHAFDALDLSRIEAACLPENVASRGAARADGVRVRGGGAAPTCRSTGAGATTCSTRACAATGAGARRRRDMTASR